MPRRKLQAHLELETQFGALLGGTRIQLLEAIDKHGSITQAAKSIPLSYKAAWDALEDLNNLADQPVIERSVGGAGGGGTRLTDYGRKLVAMFRALETEYQGAMEKLYDQAGQAEETDKAAFQRLLRRVNLRTSARNQFVGAISRIAAGPVEAQVFIDLGGGCEIEASITADSVRSLGLSVGSEVVALVKAPAVSLAVTRDQRTTDTNRIDGVVSRVNRGKANTEVVVDVPLSRVRHVTAVVRTSIVDEWKLKAGTKVTAAFPASSVILTTFG